MQNLTKKNQHNSICRNFYSQFVFILFVLTSSNSILIAQHTPSNERSDPNFRTTNQLESNNVRTTVFNFGVTGHNDPVPFSEQTPYEWYKNTGHVYLALTGLCLGAEVADENNDTIHIVDVFDERQSPIGDPWSFEPIPGYFNENNFKIASSDDPSTWPEFWPDRISDSTDPGWPGSWDGYFGKNVLINGQELYFKFTDDLYDNHFYYPDTTDLTRKGLGLVVSAHALSFNEDFLKDIVFYSYKIKNDGTKPLNKLGISFWWADFVGGEGQDNMIGYDLSHNFIWSYNKDNRSPDPAFYDEPVGSVSLSVLKFPEEGLSFNNIQYLPSYIWPVEESDEYLWDTFFTPGFIVDTTSFTPGDYNAYANINYFSLMPGETKEILVAVSFANGPQEDLSHSIRKNRMTGQYFAALAAMQGGFNFDAYDINISSPSNGQTFSDNVNITWNTGGAINPIADYIYYSTDNGDSWNFLTVDSSGTGNYNWDTGNYPDGILYKVKIISASANGTAVAESDGLFKINKNNVNALPQVYIVNPKSGSEINGDYTINLISGDADNEPVEVDLFYKIGRNYDWQLLADNVQNNLYEFNSEELPNSMDFYLKAIVTSNSDSGFYEVRHIILNNTRTTYPDSTLYFNSNSPATGKFEIRVVNPLELAGDDYVTIFEKSGSYLVYDVINMTTGVTLIDNSQEVNGNREGPYFEGLRLFIQNDPLEEIDSLSGWNNENVFPLKFVVPPPPPIIHIAKRSDYRIEIGNLGIDTSKFWIYQTLTLPSIPVNFKVYNISEQKYIDFAFYERDNSGGDGLFTKSGLSDFIFCLEPSEPDTLSYLISLSDCDTCRNPESGDLYNHYITKPFYAGDSIFFSTQNITAVIENPNPPSAFILDQNYPNPFNPTTKIRFQIPEKAFVQLEVFDILGRRVANLINKELSAGKYESEFDGKKFASGVYVYRIKAGNFISAKKMLLLK
jgi:Secretion system C-terminal sorting domain